MPSAFFDRNPQLTNAIDEVTKTPIAGLYELRVDKEILYSDEQGNYLIFPSRDQTDGHLLDARSKTDLTEQRFAKMMAQDIPKLPYGDALVFKQGSGARARCLVVCRSATSGLGRLIEAHFGHPQDIESRSEVGAGRRHHSTCHQPGRQDGPSSARLHRARLRRAGEHHI